MTLMRNQFSDVGVYDTLNGEFKHQLPAAENQNGFKFSMMG